VFVGFRKAVSNYLAKESLDEQAPLPASFLLSHPNPLFPPLISFSLNYPPTLKFPLAPLRNTLLPTSSSPPLFLLKMPKPLNVNPPPSWSAKNPVSPAATWPAWGCSVSFVVSFVAGTLEFGEAAVWAWEWGGVFCY
jgi:hypothetical protein